MRRKSKSMLLPVLMAASTVLFTMCVQKGQVQPESPDNGDDVPGEVPDDIPDEVPEVPEHEDTLYITGVEYPAGYNWVKDPHVGHVDCTLFVEKAGERILELKVGNDYEMASCYDMHRYVKGHLYTDFSTNDETIIKKDGVELFRYPGEEMIVSFHVSENGDVYWVGVPRSGGDGFTFRKNGEQLASTDMGRILSDIIDYDGRICLLYSVLKESKHGGAGYYLYDNGSTESFAGISDHKEVLAATLSADGKVCYVGSVGEGDSFSYFVDGVNVCHLGSEQFGTLETCALTRDGDNIYIRGKCISPSKQIIYIVWDNKGGLLYSLPPMHSPLQTFVEGGKIYDIVRSDDQNGVLCYIDGTMVRSYGANSTFYGITPAAVCNGKLYLLFSNRTDRLPRIGVDEEVIKSEFNGYYLNASVGR